MNITALNKLFKATKGNSQPVNITKKQSMRAYDKLLADGYIEAEDGYNYYIDDNGNEYLKIQLTYKGVKAVESYGVKEEYIEMNTSQLIDLIMKDQASLPQPATPFNIRYYKTLLDYNHAVIQDGFIVAIND